MCVCVCLFECIFCIQHMYSLRDDGWYPNMPASPMPNSGKTQTTGMKITFTKCLYFLIFFHICFVFYFVFWGVVFDCVCVRMYSMYVCMYVWFCFVRFVLFLFCFVLFCCRKTNQQQTQFSKKQTNFTFKINFCLFLFFC